MSEIKVGDLVMVVGKSFCGCTLADGRIFLVQDLDTRAGKCIGCDKKIPLVKAALQENGRWIEFSRLKKINPSSDEMKRETERERETT